MKVDVIYNKDCLEGMKRLPSKSIDLVVTDPPYGVNYDIWDTGLDEKIMEQIFRVCDSTIIMFGGASTQSINNYMKYNPERCIIWSPSFTLSHTMANGLAFRWHPIWCWNLPKKIDSFHWDILTDRCECGNWWKHKATKPLSLIMKLVKIKEGIVLDPFIGSGTTAVACKQTGRSYIGFEINPEYYKIAQKRLAAVQAVQLELA